MRKIDDQENWLGMCHEQIGFNLEGPAEHVSRLHVLSVAAVLVPSGVGKGFVDLPKMVAKISLSRKAAQALLYFGVPLILLLTCTFGLEGPLEGSQKERLYRSSQISSNLGLSWSLLQ